MKIDLTFEQVIVKKFIGSLWEQDSVELFLGKWHIGYFPYFAKHLAIFTSREENVTIAFHEVENVTLGKEIGFSLNIFPEPLDINIKIPDNTSWKQIFKEIVEEDIWQNSKTT